MTRPKKSNKSTHDGRRRRLQQGVPPLEKKLAIFLATPIMIKSRARQVNGPFLSRNLVKREGQRRRRTTKKMKTEEH